MQRRRVLAATGTLGLAGCLRMQNRGDADTDDNPDDAPENTGNLFPTREDAIAYVSEPMTTDTLAMSTYDEEPLGGVVFSTSGGSSATTGPDDTVASARDIDLEPESEATYAFGGNTGRELRVTDVTIDTRVTFTPDGDAPRVDANRIKVNTRGDGELRDETPVFYDPNREEPATYLPGEWHGDTDMFGTHPFGEYVVTVLEAGEPVAGTDSAVYGLGYNFRFDQTETAAFLTRHASVDEEWEAVFSVDDIEAIATHRPDDGVFELDLATLDVGSGRHDWRFELRDSDVDRSYREYLSLRNSLAGELLIP